MGMTSSVPDNSKNGPSPFLGSCEFRILQPVITCSDEAQAKRRLTEFSVASLPTHAAMTPPSTVRMLPVVQRDSSEAK